MALAAPQRRRIAVVGGGWAGIAAAVQARSRGHAVELFEMAPQLGGRARSFEVDGIEIDNGQHIAIGAYAKTLALLRQVGVDPAQAFMRTPLRLVDANGVGLRLRPGPPALAFGAAVLAHRGWSLREKLGLLFATSRWGLRGFRCDPRLTVDALCARISTQVRDELIAPLCVAALNTASHEASAVVFLRVLREALFGGRGASDLLLPRIPLSRVLADPALAWLRGASATIHPGHRVQRIEPHADGWRVDEADADAVVLAASSTEAVRLTQTIAADWSRAAGALEHEPIVTVYTRAEHARLPGPMLSLPAGPGPAPAQFVFDRGQLGGPAGLFAFVISGAREWVARGNAELWQAIHAQAARSMGEAGRARLELVKIVTEQRATFRCVPGLVRPPQAIAPGLVAAADFVAGPYPATLEGAVRSGVDAIRALEVSAPPRRSAGAASRRIQA